MTLINLVTTSTDMPIRGEEEGPGHEKKRMDVITRSGRRMTTTTTRIVLRETITLMEETSI